MKQLSLLTLLFVAAIASAQNEPIVEGQTESVVLVVDDPRPLSAAVESLIERHPISITYEDPRYEFSGDIRDVTSQVRKNPSATDSRVLVPRGGVLQTTYEISNGQPASAADTVRQIVETKNLDPVGGRFEVYQDGDVFHIVPTEIRDSRGAWVKQQSILRTPITFSSGELNGFQLIEAILKQVSAASGANILGMSAERFTNAFYNYRGQIDATDEPARDVLLRALHSIHPRFTWFLNYDPSGQYYAFAVAKTTEPEFPEPPEPPPVTAPRPGDPTPAGPPFRPRND